MTELAPPGMTQTRSWTLCQRSPRRTQAMAAPAATLCPWIARAPPSKVIVGRIQSKGPKVPRGVRRDGDLL
eukprot:878589-Lingulodinium_polyedra.AAC.1